MYTGRFLIVLNGCGLPFSAAVPASFGGLSMATVFLGHTAQEAGLKSTAGLRLLRVSVSSQCFLLTVQYEVETGVQVQIKPTLA